MRTDRKLFCLKTLLTVFLWILWFVGAAIFGLFLWLRLDFWTNEYLELNSNFDRHLILLYICLVAGAVITAFSIFGLIGGCLKVKWLLAVYLVVVILALLLTIAAVVYGTIYREELRNTLVSDNLLGDIVRSSYRNDSTHKISRVMDIMQSKLECCGSEGPLDYNDSNWRNQILGNQAINVNNGDLLPVPASCCKEYFHSLGDSPTCNYYEADKKQSSAGVWTKGCEERLQQFLDKYILVVVGVAGVYFILQVICMTICSVYLKLLNSLYVPQPDDIVYDMAHNQEKSPYPSRGDYREYYS